MDGDVEKWCRLRDGLRREIEERGVGPDGAFRQAYDNEEVDASLLQLPQTGFCDYDDPRMLRTVERIEAELADHLGFVHRYRTHGTLDGLDGGEATFLICSFWLVEQYAHTGRLDDAEALMQRLCDTAGELGLLAEEYDPVAGQMLGNFPQAFSHLGLIRAVDAIGVCRGQLERDRRAGRYGTAARRSQGDGSAQASSGRP